MKLKYQFAVSDFAGKKVALVLGEDLGKYRGYLKMDQTGSEIFELLKEDLPEMEVIRKMTELYPDENPEEVASVVRGFLGKLENEGLLQGS